MDKLTSKRGMIMLLSLFVVAFSGLYVTVGMTRAITETRVASSYTNRTQALQLTEAALDVALAELAKPAYDNASSMTLIPRDVPMPSGSQVTATRLTAPTGITNTWKLIVTYQPGPQPPAPLQPPVRIEAHVYRAAPPASPGALYGSDRITVDDADIEGPVVSNGPISFNTSLVNGDVTSTLHTTTQTAITVVPGGGRTTINGDLKTNADTSFSLSGAYAIDLGNTIVNGPAGGPGARLLVGAHAVTAYDAIGTDSWTDSHSHIIAKEKQSAFDPPIPAYSVPDVAIPPQAAPAVISDTSCNSATTLPDVAGAQAAPIILSGCYESLTLGRSVWVRVNGRLAVRTALEQDFYSKLEVPAGSQLVTDTLVTHRAELVATGGARVRVNHLNLFGGTDLTLPGGLYQFQTITTESGAANRINMTFTAERGTELYVTQAFHDDPHTHIRTTDQNPRNLTVYLMNGTTLDGAGFDHVLIGSVYGPHSDVIIGYADIGGSVVGRTVTLNGSGPPHVHLMNFQGSPQRVPVTLESWRVMHPNEP